MFHLIRVLVVVLVLTGSAAAASTIATPALNAIAGGGFTCKVVNVSTARRTLDDQHSRDVRPGTDAGVGVRPLASFHPAQSSDRTSEGKT